MDHHVDAPEHFGHVAIGDDPQIEKTVRAKFTNGPTHHERERLTGKTKHPIKVLLLALAGDKQHEGLIFGQSQTSTKHAALLAGVGAKPTVVDSIAYEVNG